jgi:hypothetical protein
MVSFDEWVHRRRLALDLTRIADVVKKVLAENVGAARAWL